MIFVVGASSSDEAPRVSGGIGERGLTMTGGFVGTGLGTGAGDTVAGGDGLGFGSGSGATAVGAANST